MICMISHSVETPRGTGAFFFNTLRLRRPMRAGIFSVLLFSSQPLCLFNPLALRALPLYSLTETQGERIEKWSFSLCCFVAPRKAAGHGRGEVKISFR